MKMFHIEDVLGPRLLEMFHIEDAEAWFTIAMEISQAGEVIQCSSKTSRLKTNSC